jgi:hypothetical protein
MILEMKITLEDNGTVSVSGPINDQAISFMLLTAAKEVVKKHNRPVVQPALTMPANLFGGRQQ